MKLNYSPFLEMLSYHYKCLPIKFGLNSNETTRHSWSKQVKYTEINRSDLSVGLEGPV